MRNFRLDGPRCTSLCMTGYSPRRQRKLRDASGQRSTPLTATLVRAPQTTGEAIYTSDFGSDAAQLFASTVESTEPLAYVRAIDASPALEVGTSILPNHQDTPPRSAR